MKAGKAVYRQMERTVKALLRLSADKDPKTYSESRTLLTAICNMEFIFGLCVLKVILSNTNNLCRYLQRSTVGVISSRWNADMTIQTLHQCRSEKRCNSVCQIASAVGLKIKSSWPILSLNYEKPGHPDKCHRAAFKSLYMNTCKDQRSWHWNRTTGLTLTMRPSTGCCPSLSSGLEEMIRKYSVLWKISVTVKPLIKGASPALLNFTNETLEAEQKMYASFRLVRGLGYLMTVSEMLETMRKNDLFDMFSEFSYLVHIPAVIPATSRSAQRSFIALRRLKTYLRSTWDNNVSVTSQLFKGHMPPL